MKEAFVNFENERMLNPTDYLINKCIRSGRDQGVVIGNSGREIYFQKDNYCFNLFDKKYDIYHLKSQVLAGNICSFDLSTKKESSLHEIDSVDGRHPDFMATKYVKSMLNYYQNQNIEISAIRSIWTNQSDNHLQFVQEFKKTKDPVMAALSTYSGKLFSSIGYSYVPKKKLFMNYENEMSRIPQLICVDFIKE